MDFVREQPMLKHFASLRTYGWFLCAWMMLAVPVAAQQAADPKPAATKPDPKPTATKKTDDKKAADDKKTADEKKAAEKKAADDKKAADALKAAEAKRVADAAKKAADDAKRLADEAKRAEEKRKADEARVAREAQMKAEAEAKAVREAQLKAEADAKAAAAAAARAVADRAEAIYRVKLTRTADDVFRAVARLEAGGDKNLAEDQKYLLYVQSGEWEKLRDLTTPFTDEQKDRMYMKLLNDLSWGNPKAVMLPTDVLRIADIAPTELEDKQATQLGRLLSLSIGKTDSRAELMAALKKGTAKLGGTDPKRRQITARMLGSAEFWEEAKAFGLKGNEIPTVIADAKVDTTADSAADAWDRFLAQLRDPARTAEERDIALTGLHQALLQLTPAVLDAKLGAVIADKAHAELMWEILGFIGSKTARGQDNFDYDLRRSTLDVQHAAVRLLAKSRPLDAQPAKTLANLFARNWLTESQFTINTFPNWKKSTPEYRHNHQHVPLDGVLHSAPAGPWLAVLEPQLAATVKMNTAKLILLSDEVERLVPHLAEFASRDKTLAADLANQYFTRWAQLHNPNLTPEAQRKLGLEGQPILLTRAEQELSLKRLGDALKNLDPATRALVDESLLVEAFDLCHSKAEPYTRDQITAVFGPLEQVPPSLLSLLLERMRTKLATSWRDISVQRDAATKRDTDDVFELVDAGYAEGEKIADQWLKSKPDDWHINCATGALLSDWAEFAYFQAVATKDDTERFQVYLKRNGEALARFRAGAKAYAAAVPKLDREEFSLFPYKAWFQGLLGISQDSGVNLRKGTTKESLAEVRQAMQSLPGGAAGVHMKMFSDMVAENLKNNVIAPAMKYRYLSSAVEITGRSDTVYPAQEKVQYYESLLTEIRLRTRLDGSAEIRRGGEFGVFVTLVHTADLQREAGGFGKYLQNETKRVVNGRETSEKPLYRDKFEAALRQSLGDFFEIKAIVFADPAAGSRPMIPDETAASSQQPKPAAPKPAAEANDKWLETPLAYLHLAPKSATVDRVPPLEIELDFFDRDGKVVIPVPAPPILIDVNDKFAARRAATNIAVTETVDGRELVGAKRLKMDVVATGRGLVPELNDLLEMQSYALKPTNVDERAGLRVTEFHSGDDGLYAVSERNYSVELDPAPILHGANDKVEFQFPKPKSGDFVVTYRTFKDMDPIAAAETVTLVEGKEAAAIAKRNYWGWAIGGIALGALIGFFVVRAMRKKPDTAVAGPPAFTMPREATPFAVVTLLHRIRKSSATTLTEAQRAELEREIVALERAAFANGAAHRSTPDLASVADRWIKTAT